MQENPAVEHQRLKPKVVIDAGKRGAEGDLF
jgi:hypothetical protein